MVFRSFDVRINENERKGLLEKPVFLYAFIYICQLTHYPDELMSGYESGGIFLFGTFAIRINKFCFSAFFNTAFSRLSMPGCSQDHHFFPDSGNRPVHETEFAEQALFPDRYFC